jgi:serine phosphatase RsbU (regulator of sigma subunit)
MARQSLPVLMNIESSSANINGLKLSVASATKEGEQVCGDTYFIKGGEDRVLLAVIDGLGHGNKAAEASKKAVELLEDFEGESIINLIKHCHNGLKKTRGVVMSLAQINFYEETITWVGVGNVDGSLIFANDEDRPKIEHFVLRGGIVGYKLPLLQATITPISPGDLLICSTDGVKVNYLGKIDMNDDPDKIVEDISSNYFKRSDDALILVAKYLG